jgi:hypothetical protein
MTTLAEACADAYLAGWALTDAPWTPRIEAGLIAAVECAAEFADDPAVLETSLILGSLEGIWATIYQRRERLQRKHERAILAAWKTVTAGLDPADVVRWFRRDTYQTAEAATKDPAKRWWQDVAITTALAWLRAVYQHHGYDALVAAVADAIRAGMAEGEAGALALAASRQGKTGFRIDQAFKAAYGRLATDHTIDQRAAAAVAGMIDAAAGDVGRRLASQAGDGAGEDDMTGGVEDVMDGGRAARTAADAGLWAGILAGAKGLYSRLASGLTGMLGGSGGTGQAPGPDTPPGGTPPSPGPVLLNWITAADARVCVTCSSYEDNSPYTPEQVPDYPHPRCRCSVDLAPDSGSSSFLAALLDSFTN